MLYLITIIFILIFIALVFKINIKKAKDIAENKELSEITKKFPDDLQIAKDMLEKLNNKDVKVEQVKGTGTSLYIAITNKISIADMKNNYARIQTIAHECMHSVQDKTLLLTNFIISNINILYFLIVSVLTILKVIHNTDIFIFVFLGLGFMQFVLRGYLETDAMTKSYFFAKDYIEEKNLCSNEEKENLLAEYKKINQIGIPFTLFSVITKILSKVLIYTIICMIF